MSSSNPAPSWSSIPNKFELAIICSVRVVDFFQQAALQAVMFYQLASFDPKASESDISFQVGVLQGVFTAAQIFTSIVWGKVADRASWGRKRVILTSLIGQGLSCLGVAFARSFSVAVVWRFLGGAVNASVGGARTALSEKTEKKYHSRTFLLLPLAWNIAQAFGPPVGGWLSDPVRYYPTLFGENSTFGAKTGVAWLRAFPYAPPSLFCALVLFADAFLVWVGLEETLQSRVGKEDLGLSFATWCKDVLSGTRLRRSEYSQVQQDEERQDVFEEEVELSTLTVPSAQGNPQQHGEASTSAQEPHLPPPFLNVLTRKVFLVLTVVAFIDFGVGAFAALWTMFLSSESYNSQTDAPRNLPIWFTGGLGFSPSTVGLAMSVLGVIGIVLQLGLYPRVTDRYGPLKPMLYAMLLYPVAHGLTPYLSLISNRFLLWLGIILVALINIAARTFSTPGAVLLVNNSAPNPQMLGTIHGLGASVQAAARTLGPILAGRWYSDGIERGLVGEAWWLLAVVALLGCLPVYWVQGSEY